MSQSVRVDAKRANAREAWPQRLTRVWRARCDRRARVSVLVLGDSHVRVFEHWWFMWALPWVRWHIVYVPGGTATGLPNPQAQTQARSQFDDALATVPHDLVLLNLGEVDTGYTIWVRAARDGVPAEQHMEEAVHRYTQFIEATAARCRLVVLGAPLPTLPDDFEPADAVGTMRQQVVDGLAARTALTLDFNARVAAACAALGVPHLDDRAASLGPNGTVHARWQRTDRHDHHYVRGTYARWLARVLRPHLNLHAAPPARSAAPEVRG